MREALFLPGHTKALSEWSDRAIAQARAELDAQLANYDRAPLLTDAQRAARILAAEDRRRRDGLSPAELRELDTLKAFEPFNRRAQAESKLEPESGRDAGREPSRDAARAPAHPSPERDAISPSLSSEPARDRSRGRD